MLVCFLTWITCTANIHSIPGVMPMQHRLEHRLDVQANLGIVPSIFQDYLTPEIRVTYHPIRYAGVAFITQNFQRMQPGFSSYPHGNISHQRYLQQYTGLHAVWKPIYGKELLSAEQIVHFETSLHGGFGWLHGTHQLNTVAFRTGVSQAFIFRNQLAVTAELGLMMASYAGTYDHTLQSRLHPHGIFLMGLSYGIPLRDKP